MFFFEFIQETLQDMKRDEARLCGLVELHDPLWTKLYMCINKRTKWIRIGTIQESMRETRFLSHMEALEQLAFENIIWFIRLTTSWFRRKKV